MNSRIPQGFARNNVSSSLRLLLFCNMKSEIRKFQFKPDLDHEIEVIDLHALTGSGLEGLTQPHRIDFYSIMLLRDCSPVHLIDFRPVVIEPYSIVCIGSGQVHCFDPHVRYEGRAIAFTERFFAVSPQDVSYLRSTSLFNKLGEQKAIAAGDTFGPLNEICTLIEKEQKGNKDEYSNKLLHQWLYSILILAERQQEKTGISIAQKGIDREYTLLFRDILERHFRQKRSVKEYAAMMKVSEWKLNQAITTTLGKAPKAMIDERVMLEAQRMLVYGSQSVKEIGFELGFDEPTNFIKYFRKHTGRTPLEFRERPIP